MTLELILQLAVLLGALLLGARAGGVALGLWGAVGLLVLVAGFGVAPGQPSSVSGTYYAAIILRWLGEA